MKTPEEIKKGLEKCSVGMSVCEGCEFSNGNAGKWQKLMGDALTYIRLLETDNSCLNNTIRNLTELLNTAHEETAAVKRERDAAERDFKGFANCEHNVCHYCAFDSDFDCGKCWYRYPEAFKWRGVCPENTEVQDGK